MGNVIQASDITVEQIQSTNGIIIYDENSTWDGNPIEWEVIGKDQDGQGTITVQTKRIFTGFAWDTKNTSGDADRQAYGASRVDSLLHQWLNSDSANWYSTQHNNQSPSSDTVFQYDQNGMDTACNIGFMSHLSLGFRSELRTVTKNVVPIESGDPSSFTGKLFCLSIRETHPTWPDTDPEYVPESGAFTYQRYLITDDMRRYRQGDIHYCWLRSFSNNFNSPTSTVASMSGYSYGGGEPAYSSRAGAAPACVLSSDISLEEDANGKYKILLSDPPTPTHEDEYLDYDGLVEVASRTERKFRFSEMPTPNASWLGKSIQYIGATTVNEPIYTHNYFYECKTKEVDGQTVYYWDVAQLTIKPITNAQIDAWWNGTGGN